MFSPPKFESPHNLSTNNKTHNIMDSSNQRNVHSHLPQVTVNSFLASQKNVNLHRGQPILTGGNNLINSQHTCEMNDPNKVTSRNDLPNQQNQSYFQQVEQQNNKNQHLQNNQQTQMSASEYLMLGMSGGEGSSSSWALVREYLRQIKQLSSEHLFTNQENQRLRESNEEFVGQNQNLRNQIAVLEQKIILYEKESSSKLSASRDKAKSLETFNKDLFNKLSYYEQAILNYEQEIKNVKQEALLEIGQAEDEKQYLNQNIESLHDTMNQAIESCEARYKQKIDAKNQKIKQLKQLTNTDKNLIESYQTELVQLQTDNKSLKDELISFQQSFTNLQFELEDALNKLQECEAELQQNLKQMDEMRKKNEELQNNLGMVINSQQSEGEDKLKVLQQMNQQQIQQLYRENEECRREFEESQQIKDNYEQEIEKLQISVREAFEHLFMLIHRNGMDEDGTVESSANQANQIIQSESFEEVKRKILDLIDQNSSLKEKKKSHRRKIEFQKEQIAELKSTLHQLVTEHQVEYNKVEQQQLQLLQQNQIQDQQQQIQLLERHQQLQQLQKQAPLQQLSNQQQHTNSSNAFFQGEQMNNINMIQKSNSTNTTPSQYQISPQRRDTYDQENNSNKYQKQIQEILDLKDKNYVGMLADCKSNNLSLIYALTKVIQRLQRQVKWLSELLRQQSRIVLAILPSQRPSFRTCVLALIFIYRLTRQCSRNSVKQQLPPQYRLALSEQHKLLRAIPDLQSDIHLLSRIRQILEDATIGLNNNVESYSAATTKSDSNNGFLGVTQSEMNTGNIKQDRYDQQTLSNSNSSNLVGLVKSESQNYGLKLNMQMTDIRSDDGLVKNGIIIIPIRTLIAILEQTIEEKIYLSKRVNLFEVIKANKEDDGNNKLIKEKHVIETENIQLKTLVVRLNEEKEDIHTQLDSTLKQMQQYKKIVYSLECQIQNLQQENEINNEKNSHLLDLIDPQKRELLEKQSVLNDFFSNSHISQQDKSMDSLNNQNNNHV